MSQQITRGDYLKDLITIYLENNLQTNITDLYSELIFQCGAIQKTFAPAQVIKISFSEQESLKLQTINTCYLAGITVDGHKETFQGSLTFNTRGEVVFYEPSSSSVTPSVSSVSCDCKGLKGFYSNCSQPAIKAYFSLNYVPTKLSELQNDTDFQDGNDVADAISEHNTSEDAHPYIRGLIDATAPNDGTLTIQKNGTTVGTFSANQSENETVNITVPTNNNELTNGAGYITGINSTDVTSALGYTPYNSSNPNDYQENVIETIKINGTAQTVTDKAVDITLDASDVGALPSDTTIDDLTTSTQQDALNSGATTTNIGQISTNTNDILAINELIPEQATSSNQLADKEYVNDAVSTNTANFIGTFNSVADLEAYSGTLTNNDYAYVVSTDSEGNTVYDRYKYTTATTPASWQFEYSLNNSSFTSTQWAAINSGITSSDVTKIGTALQPNDNISDLTNDAGYTTNVGTVTSVNNTQPDANGNVTIPMPTVDQTFDGTSANAQSGTAVAGAITDLANKSLSNLTDTGLDKINQSKALETGNVSTDADVYADILKYAHSSLNPALQTTGTVNFVDGVLSNVQSNSYVSGGTFTLGSSGIFEIDFDITLGNASNISYFIDYINGSNKEILLRQQANYNQLQALFFTSGATITVESSIALSDGLRVKGKLGYNGTDYYLIANSTTDAQTSADKMPSGDYTRYFGNRYTTASNSYLSGNRAINLKDYKELVDGIQTFSGNKTGIDTIKPDDYTVVGTPAISTDGIASGFSSSNYIYTPVINFSNADKWVLYSPKFKVTDFSDTSVILNAHEMREHENYDGIQLLVRTNGKISWCVQQVLGTNIFKKDTPNALISANVWYQLKLEFNGDSYILSLSANNGSFVIVDTYTSSTKAQFDSSSDIGANNGGLPLKGYLDLNPYEIYFDGNLVYQPCLKIPYTAGSNQYGGKYVDVTHRDKVEDAYRQGLANDYFTIDETGNNYAVVGSPVINNYIASKVNATNYIQTYVTYKNLKDKSWTIKNRAYLYHTDGPALILLHNQWKTLGGVFYNGGLKFCAKFGDASESTSEIYVANLGTLSEGWYDVSLSFDISTGTYTLYAKNVSTGVEYQNTYTPSTANKQLYIFNTHSEFTILRISSGLTTADCEYDLASYTVIVSGQLFYKAVTEPNFTLPMGEIYGMIGKRVLRDSYRNGLTYWDLYSDRTLEQGGTCESGVEYTLPKAFVDTNYILTVPYTSKTATSFIPSATGDFIAKGLGTL